MVKVIKLDNREEDFSEEKLKNSIRKAMKSIGKDNEPLIESVLSEIETFIKDKDYVLTKDLKNEIIKFLATEGNSKIAKTYVMYVKEDQSPRAGRRSSKVYSPNSTNCNKGD